MPERLLDKNHADRTARAKQLTALLERYERILDLRERRRPSGACWTPAAR